MNTLFFVCTTIGMCEYACVYSEEYVGVSVCSMKYMSVCFWTVYWIYRLNPGGIHLFVTYLDIQ